MCFTVYQVSPMIRKIHAIRPYRGWKGEPIDMSSFLWAGQPKDMVEVRGCVP
jgi:hypothetical protein